MTRKYTNNDDDFKRMLVELVNSGKGINEVSREYGVPSSSIRGWIKRFSKMNTPNKEESIEYAEFLKMKKELASIKEENEILKKALSIFAKK